MALLVLISDFCLLTSAVAADNSPRLAQDFESIMGWLSSEASDGMAFHSAVSFDPPVELKPGAIGFDANFGLGTIPMHKNTFPKLQVQTLQDSHPENSFSDTTLFPDMTGHLRYGLEDRVEISGRLSNMTVPRHNISPDTEGEGQSNIVGISVRKHLGHPKLERVTMFASYDYIFGGFKFYNGFTNVRVLDGDCVTTGLCLNTKNKGELSWGIKTFGAGFTISYDMGKWVPYYGFGYHYSQGAVKTRLQSVFEGGLVSPVIGEGNTRVDARQQLRLTLGTMKKGKHISWYGATEVLIIGSKSGKAFAAHFGFHMPLKMGDRQPLLKETTPEHNPPSDLKDSPRDLDLDEEEEVQPSLIIIR